MFKSCFEGWVNLCHEHGSEIFELEHSDRPNTGLYKTQETYEYKHYYYFTDPMFHIWIDDHHGVCKDYKEAYDIYKARLER